jgi:predicted PurR-regulated permease PerM
VEKVPNVFQRRTLWTAITALSITTIGALIVGFVWLLTRIIAFLQPILIPFAVAGVLAYLLEPVVNRLIAWRIKRQYAVMCVFVMATAVIVGVAFLGVPALVKQGGEFAETLLGTKAHDGVPAQVGALQKARVAVEAFAQKQNANLKERFGVDLLHWTAPTTEAPKTPAPLVPPAPVSAVPTGAAPPPQTAELPQPNVTPPPIETPNEIITLQTLLSGDWLAKTLPDVGRKLWHFINSSVGGFLGAFGFLLSLVIVPLYLYYFLLEGPKITSTWSNYIPLRASRFKDEVVSTLTEINRYLIAFFRGQLVVSIINGAATGIGLPLVGLKFGWLIGLSLCVLGIIPYLGIIVCWIPAVVIASVQGGSYLIPETSAWWVFPLVVTAIFAAVQQVDGLFVTPKIVGGSVGLHPMTVIVSVFAWSLILGGLLGAILAVPMTAALKVLFQRYVWERAMSGRRRASHEEPAAG